MTSLTSRADCRQQTVGVKSARVRSLRELASNLIAVREQIVKDSDDRIAEIPVFAQRHGERNRNGVVPREPCGIVREVDGAAAFPPKSADEPTVQINLQGRVRGRAGHQNSSAMLSVVVAVRGLTNSSRFNAIRASISTPI